MRKLLFFVASLFITGSLLAGGLVTNNNQSAMFARLQNRNASTSIDAVYFNPAGVTRLGEGFFASINNQTISQTQKVISTYPYLDVNPKEYVGKVSAPIFPGVYVAYNTGNLSFSAGVNPIGGGGGAKYDKGLPSFESMVAGIPALLSFNGIPTTKYSADIYFEGSSVYMGYQGNIAYKINDQLSFGAGVRIVSATNKYKGHISGIMINPNYTTFGAEYNGGMVSAPAFFTAGNQFLTAASAQAAGASTQLAGTAASLQPLITGGAGSVPLANGTGVGLTAIQVATLQATITTLGGDPTNMTIAQAQSFFSTASGNLSNLSNDLSNKAGDMAENAAASADKQVDASQSGTGITPIVSASFSPNDQLDIAIKYEFKTKLTLKTEVAENMGAGIFINGQEIIADMPAELSIGVNYKPISKLSIAASFDEYFDKNVDYDGSKEVDVKMIDKNFLQYGLGLEYGLTEDFRISAGWTHTSTGVNSNYQSDQSFSTSTNSFGAGFGYRISPMIDLNIGGQYTVYDDDTKTLAPTVTETYKKMTWLIGAGLDFYFGKK